MTVPGEALIAGVFYAFALLAIVGALGLVAVRRIFHSALFLVLTLMSVAAEFVILGADFLAAAQVLVYVGAIMVLILFGIMLTPQQVNLPNLGGLGQQVAAVVAAASVFSIAAGVILFSQWPRSVLDPSNVPTTSTIGQALFTTFVLPFELVSVLLAAAMIGAIVIAREE